MSFLRYLPFVAAVGVGVALLAGAVRPKTNLDAGSCPYSPPPVAIPDDEASRILDAAVDALDPTRIGWLSTNIKQRVQLPDLAFTAEGQFQAAPGNRFRLELRTGLGDRTTTLLALNDGDILWRAHRHDDGKWSAVRRREIANEETENATSDEPFADATFVGPGSLLKNLRRRLVWTKHAEMREAGRPAIELTGVWPNQLASKGHARTAGQPDRCRLLLDDDTLWPLRVEWWGKDATGKRLACLMCLELSDPILNRPLSAEAFAQTFTFDPGRAAVVEETKDDAATTEGLK